jgi:hypothetical protein
MGANSGANILHGLLSTCVRRLVGVDVKAHGEATAPLLRELGIASIIEATATSARTRASLKRAP